MLLLKAMLQDIGFDDAMKEISDPGLRFSPLNFAYTLAWMTINDVDATYQLNEMDLRDLAVFLNVPKSPLKDDIYNFYRALTEEMASIPESEFNDAPNIHQQKRYEKLQGQLPKVEARIKQSKNILLHYRDETGFP